MGGSQIKYVIHPGFVLSKQDKDTHYIGYSQLIALYGVDPRNCELYSPMFNYGSEYVHLHPRFDGNYATSSWEAV